MSIILSRDGSQTQHCAMPFRYDSYRGCTHGCLYCFATKANKRTTNKEEFFKSIEQGKINELETFLKKQSIDEYMEKTPIHWGGMSDGFQPAELYHGLSYQSLLLFRKYQYPVVISTKGVSVISSDKYLEVLRECKAVVQVSLMCKDTKIWDRGADDYNARLNGINKLTQNGVKVIIRNQPYMAHFHPQIMEMVGELSGVYGFIAEGYKTNKKQDGFVKRGGDFVYPIKLLFRKFIDLRQRCEANGIKFFCGENRLRWLGDSVNCCGVAEIDGFEGQNRLNLTNMFFHKNITYSTIPKLQGKFRNSSPVQDTIGDKWLRLISKDGYGVYNFIRNYVNNGSFALDYELDVIGTDKNGNKVFKYKDKEIESHRQKFIKNKK